ncbi:hypothetical protein QAD02_011666 [Eretmocerus hayati]|uniref:Uncharacterized protein n=1 Tax=Eretmocerus hayati TaxID=131215 RepID=A0ACC2NX50_9HYME|nr:hypothetical protein QAD02_011666 [Eretmocerus hayati]
MRNALSRVISSRDLDIVRSFVESGGSINQVYEDGSTLLLNAVAHEHVEVALYLLEHGADPDIGSGFSDFGGPLLAAVRLGQVDLCSSLLRYGATIKSVNEIPSYVHQAHEDGFPGIVLELLNYGLNPHMLFTGPNHCETLLIYAVRKKVHDIVASVLRFGAKLNVPGSHGKTCLYYAIINEDTEMVSALIAHGADPNVFDAIGKSLLSHAIRTRNSAVVESLVIAGSNIEIMDLHGMQGNSLQVSLRSKQPHMVLKLVALGANVNHVNCLRESVLDTCLECLFDKIYDSATCCILFQKLILYGGLTKNMRSYPYIPAEFFTYSSIKFLQILIDNGLRIRTEPEVGIIELPLHLTLDNPNNGFLECLICTHNLCLQQRDQCGSTPFFVACENFQLTKMQLLHRLGANVNITNSANVTALQCTILPDFVTQCFQWLMTVSNIETILQTLSHVVNTKNELY